MIAITGATGHLGRLVLSHLLKAVPAAQLVAVGRDAAKAADLVARGVAVRVADYNDPAALDRAFAGVERLLLVSSSEVGQRAAQHRNAIDAARRQGVRLIVYTSLLHADVSPLNLADEHRATEQDLAASGVPHVILRNGWYTENYASSIGAAVAHGAVIGSAGTGRISAAARTDYAEAAAKIVTGPLAPVQRVYELAGDGAFTLNDLAAEISRQTGRTIPYRDLSEGDYAAALTGAGLPGWLAAALASWDVGAARGALFDDGRQLSRLIGRPTTPLAASVQAILRTSGK